MSSVFLDDHHGFCNASFAVGKLFLNRSNVQKTLATQKPTFFSLSFSLSYLSSHSRTRQTGFLATFSYSHILFVKKKFKVFAYTSDKVLLGFGFISSCKKSDERGYLIRVFRTNVKSSLAYFYLNSVCRAEKQSWKMSIFYSWNSKRALRC